MCAKYYWSAPTIWFHTEPESARSSSNISCHVWIGSFRGNYAFCFDEIVCIFLREQRKRTQGDLVSATCDVFKRWRLQRRLLFFIVFNGWSLHVPLSPCYGLHLKCSKKLHSKPNCEFPGAWTATIFGFTGAWWVPAMFKETFTAYMSGTEKRAVMTTKDAVSGSPRCHATTLPLVHPTGARLTSFGVVVCVNR